MAERRQSGKLAVILHADVAGSTELVHQDEQLAHRRIQDTFGRFGNIISQYYGRVRELRGDALLAEFERASDAVSAALAFQADHNNYLVNLNDPIQPTLRVGIAMGEVVIADNTITGAGVVLAQRLEQLAEPAGVVIQAAAQETIPNRFQFEYMDLGSHEVKGFDKPVQAYSASLGKDTPIPLPERTDHRLRNSMVAVAAVTVVAVGAALMWFEPWEVREEPASIEQMAFPLPDKPSIAVLPFVNMSNDDEQEFFVDGMTEDLITDISQVSGLFVVARNSVFTYKGKVVKVRQVAEELGVRYVLEGSVRRAGNQVRINAQLIDATTGGHLWAERYDGSLADVFALQDRVTRRIVDALSVTLTPQEIEDLESLGTAHVAAHDAYLQGLSFYLRGTPADNATAEKHYLRAVELDPEFKRAYAALAKVYYRSASAWEYSDAIGISPEKAIGFAYENLARVADAKIADAHVIRAQMALFKHQVDVALREAERALELNGSDPEAMKARASALIYSGRYAEGRNWANQAIRLDPAVIDEPLYIIGLSYFAEGDYRKSVEFLQRAIEIDPETGLYHRLLMAAYGKLGMEREAKESFKNFRNFYRFPFWVAAAVYFYPFEDSEVLERLADGLEVAGTAVRPPSRYLNFVPATRLTGTEIKRLLFGHRIKGVYYWTGYAWAQTRSGDGKVSHTGASLHTGFLDIEEHGDGWIEDDRLCEKWARSSIDITICVLVFRAPDGDEYDYYMAADSGPHPFRIID